MRLQGARGGRGDLVGVDALYAPSQKRTAAYTLARPSTPPLFGAFRTTDLNGPPRWRSVLGQDQPYSALRGRAPRGSRAPRPPLLRVENQADGPVQLFIYDEIGFFGTTASDVQAELATIDADEITVRINSPGGDVFEGIGIYRQLLDHPATVNVQVDALAASIASVIAMAGERVVMAEHSMMMIHETIELVVGDASDMPRASAALEKQADLIAGIYQARGGGEIAEWRARMTAETWLTADEAA